MTNVGYATLSIIPSMQGFSSLVEREMAPQLARVGRTAGVSAGREIGSGIQKGVHEKTSSSSVFGNIEKGAAVAGVGAGRRFGTALHETLGEYTKTIGATMVGFFAYEKVKEFLTGVVEESRKAAANERITEAIIKSTGEAAGVTAEEVGKLTDAMSKKTGIDKEAIASSENVLLTFKGVRNEVGKGNDIFNQASQAILDISTVMAGSGGSDGGNTFSGAARQLGKALNDPVKGLTALTRVGVTFTQDQKDQIKAMVASGHTLDAQKIILKEIQSEYGGAAAASGDAVSKMSASFKIFEAELGKKALPAVEGFASAVSTKGLPALEATGEYAAKVAEGWSKLDPVVKIATEALIAFKVASKFGYIDTLTQSMSALRLNTQLVALEYDTARESQGRFASGAKAARLAVSLTDTATRRSIAGIAGMGLALSGLDSSSNKTTKSLSQIGTGALLGFSVGGPWGAAIGGAIGLLGNLAHAGGKVSESEDAIKRSVSSVTETLNQQTGAITKSTTAAAEKALADGGVYDAAKRLGVNLGDLTRAYLGIPGAAHAASVEIDQGFNKRLREGGSAVNGLNSDMQIVTNAMSDGGSAIADAGRKIRDTATATKEMKGATKDGASTLQTYAQKAKDARGEIVKLANAENKRRIQNLQDKQDRLSLIEQMQATAAEAKKGKKTLDEQTKAGQANAQALYDMANQWNNSSKAVRQAKGEYAAVRQAFIQDAIQMGDTRAEAKKLADQILTVPKRHYIDIKTPGMKQALADIRALKDEVKGNQHLAINVAAHQAGNRMLAGARALGGPVVKGQRYLVGENGPEEFTAPENGSITPNDKIGGRGGHTFIHNGDIVANDPSDYMRWNQKRTRHQSGGGVNF